MITKRSTIVIWVIAAAIVITVPICLNFLLPKHLCTVIGGEKSSEVWLNFFSTYIGIIVSISVPLYVLYKTRKDNFYMLAYQFEKTELEKSTSDMLLLLKSYMENDIFHIYNEWRKSNGSEVCKVKVKNLLDKAAIAFEAFSMHYSNEQFQEKGTFAYRQGENYKQLVYLLQELQAVVSVPNYFWNNPKEIGSSIITQGYPLELLSAEFMNALLQAPKEECILELLFKCHPDIAYKKVETQIREYIHNQRKKLHNKYKNINQWKN